MKCVCIGTWKTCFILPIKAKIGQKIFWLPTLWTCNIVCKLDFPETFFWFLETSASRVCGLNIPALDLPYVIADKFSERRQLRESVPNIKLWLRPLRPRHTVTLSMQMPIIILRCNCLEYCSGGLWSSGAIALSIAAEDYNPQVQLPWVWQRRIIILNCIESVTVWWGPKRIKRLRKLP